MKLELLSVAGVSGTLDMVQHEVDVVVFGNQSVVS